MTLQSGSKDGNIMAMKENSLKAPRKYSTNNESGRGGGSQKRKQQ